MEKKGRLMTYRPDIKVLDATLRDGGLCNNFDFSDSFVKALYQTNVKAGVDYMEFGYKADPDLFSEDEFGKWKFCKDDDIRAVVGDNNTGLKISVMADVGRCNYERDIIPKSESPIDMVRIATYLHTIPKAMEMIDYCHKQGYETTINIMAISTAKTEDLDEALSLLADSPLKAIYLVDSYGSLYPEQIAELVKKYLAFGEKNGKEVGIHTHNNQQLAFANTIEALSLGASMLDATINGIGRGAGNCSSELLIGFLKNPRYHLTPLLKFIENYMLELKSSGVQWGYDIPYLCTGRLNQHPRTAIAAVKEGRTDYAYFNITLMDRD